MKRFAWVLLLSLCSALGLAQYPVFSYPNVVYTSASGVPQALDFYAPVPPGYATVGSGGFLPIVRPAIVFVHGGGWIGGSKEDMDGLAYYYAYLGYVTVSVNYRLSTVAPWPASIDDCQAAVRWLRKNAGFLHVNPNAIGALGISAGGHLVACMATNDTLHDFDPSLSGVSSRIQACVDYLGPSDLTNPVQWRPDIWYDIELEVGHPWTGDPTDFRALSPAFMVSKGDAPTLVFGSASDDIVPIAQSRSMAGALKKAGVPMRYVEFPGAGHGFTSAEWNKCLTIENAFLSKWLFP